MNGKAKGDEVVLKRKNKQTALLLFMAVLLSILLPIVTANTYQAATSYTNAKEFYNSTALDGEEYHVETVNGTIYYATYAKLAGSSSNLKYLTLGFDITLSGDGYAVSFAIQRTGGSMKEVSNTDSDGYQYILYAVESDTLYNLAQTVDPASAAYVFRASQIHVEMNAIMTTKSGTDINGSIAEDGSGGLTEDGTIYHLKDSDDLTAIKSVFTGHEFKSYYDISSDLENYQLSIRYALDGTASLANSSSTQASVGKDYSLADITSNGTTAHSVLHQNSSPYTTSARVLQQMYLLTPDTLSLTKKGYHLDIGSEWITSDGRVFDSSTVYMPKDIDPDVGYQNKNIYMYANWQPNTYTIHYNSNGGIGFAADTKHSFDQPKQLRVNTCVKAGYTLVPGAEWNTEPDGSGISYASGETVSNLISEDNGSVTLYANWQEGVYQVNTSKNGGSGGTDNFFEKFNIGWFSDLKPTTPINSIAIPQKAGYTFTGYSQYYYGLGESIVDANGNILIAPDYYDRNASIYASYKANTYTITFDKQGGTGGSDALTAVYDELLPLANAPVRNGYTFQGYYDQKNGKGNLYYNEYMATDKLYQIDGNLNLYAYWSDETPPVTSLSVSTEEWTNQSAGVEVLGSAVDVGKGLDHMELYCGSTLVSQKTELNGAKSSTITFAHKTEGVYQYKVVAYDTEGNISESYATVKYDVTKPKGSYHVTNNTLYNFSIEMNATDYNIQ